ncbi:MAG: hypothetical protein AMXMBFR46_25520 [Acidimicrobiia bacterium]
MTGVRLLVAARTDVGRHRPGNEDAFLVHDDASVIAVADGMGGHQAGEVASATAIAALTEWIDRGSAVDEAITEANHAVYAMAAEDFALRGMGTTMTAGVVDGPTLVIGHVGDSRAYLWRDGQLRQLTTDHSVIAELIAAGELTEEEAEIDPRRSMITRALGIDPWVAVDVLHVDLAADDRLLLCSDGLTTMVRDDTIAAVLAAEHDPEHAAEQLVAAANDAGGVDNITVIVADVVVDPDDSDPLDPARAHGTLDPEDLSADEPTDEIEAVVVEVAGVGSAGTQGTVPVPTARADAETGTAPPTDHARDAAADLRTGAPVVLDPSQANPSQANPSHADPPHTDPAHTDPALTDPATSTPAPAATGAAETAPRRRWWQRRR